MGARVFLENTYDSAIHFGFSEMSLAYSCMGIDPPFILLFYLYVMDILKLYNILKYSKLYYFQFQFVISLPMFIFLQKEKIYLT